MRVKWQLPRVGEIRSYLLKRIVPSRRISVRSPDFIKALDSSFNTKSGLLHDILYLLDICKSLHIYLPFVSASGFTRISIR